MNQQIIQRALLAILFMAVMGCQNYGKETSAKGVQIFYTPQVTMAEVEDLKRVLVSSGFADGNPKTVQYTKEGNTYQFRMVTKKGIHLDPKFQQAFQLMTKELSQGLFQGRHKVDVHVCDDRLKTIRVFVGQ